MFIEILYFYEVQNTLLSQFKRTYIKHKACIKQKKWIAILKQKKFFYTLALVIYTTICMENKISDLTHNIISFSMGRVSLSNYDANERHLTLKGSH